MPPPDDFADNGLPELLAVSDSQFIALARAFDMHCVAEGVESEEIHQALLQMGCEVGQGNGIGLPMPADALPGWRPSTQPRGFDLLS